ncbi:MAG TPA: hypothetical protein PK507_02945 [bacterium]|nr:hypothetical protein [bacterium]
MLALNHDFSVEDLMYGARPRQASITQADAKMLLNIKGYESLINDTSCEDSFNFSTEAFVQYGEAVTFGSFATEGLNQLQREYKVIANLKEQFGIEGLDVYTYGLEADKETKKVPGAGNAKRANLISRIWSAIVAAFQRLITAVGNFIRSVLNGLKGAFMKASIKFYETHAKDIPVGIKKLKEDSKRKWKMFKPTTNVLTIVNGLSSYLPKIDSAAKKFDAKAQEVAALADAIGTGKFGDATGLKGLVQKLSGYKNPDKVMGDILNTIKDAVSFGNSKVQSQIFSAAIPKLTMTGPSKVASIIFYGTDKPKATEVDVSDFIKVSPLSLLSGDAVKAMKDFVKHGQASTKQLNASLKTVRASASKASALAGKAVSKGTVSITQQTLNMLTQYANISRVFNGYMVGVILNLHKEFMRQQSYVNSIARAAVKATGKAKTAKKDDKTAKK